MPTNKTEYQKKYRLKTKENLRAYQKKYRLKYKLRDKEKIIERNKLYRLNNKHKIKQYYLNNKEIIKKKVKEYNLNNPHIRRAAWSKRKASQLKATPKFANLNKIREIYKKCPKGYVVDHIIPLQSKIVCGLHVEWNLQYLTPSANCSKSNKLIC
jgi:hypothetical protein